VALSIAVDESKMASAIRPDLESPFQPRPPCLRWNDSLEAFSQIASRGDGRGTQLFGGLNEEEIAEVLKISLVRSGEVQSLPVCGWSVNFVSESA
jgi:hypothetical protein